MLACRLTLPRVGRSRVLFLACVFGSPRIVKVRRVLLPVLAVGARLFSCSPTFLAARCILLEVGVLDLSLVGCSPLLFALPLARQVPLLAVALLLIQELNLFLSGLCLLLLG